MYGTGIHQQEPRQDFSSVAAHISALVAKAAPRPRQLFNQFVHVSNIDQTKEVACCYRTLGTPTAGMRVWVCSAFGKGTRGALSFGVITQP